MKRLVIFDLDGTLLNTIEDLGRAANYALETNGFPTHSIASYPYFVGNGVRKLIERVLPEDIDKNSVIDKMLADFKSYYNEHNTEYSVPYPGIADLLSWLQEEGIKMAVASNKYDLATQKLINHYFPNINFTAVEGQKDGVPVKPDPSIVFSILARAKERKADTLYVGDSGVDMETARRACIDSVGVTWGFRPEKELIEYHAGRIVNTPIEIEKIVEQYIG